MTAVLFHKHNALGHDDLERLAGLADLHLVDLTSTNVTDAGLRYLALLSSIFVSCRFLADKDHRRRPDASSEMHELRGSFCSYRTGVTDAGSGRILRSCQSLRLVELKHTQVTDAGVQLLVRLPKLDELIVDDTRRDSGIRGWPESRRRFPE